MAGKRLLYVPGIISLIGIPLLFLIFNVKDPVRPVVLKMLLPADKKDDDNNIRLTSSFVLSDVKKKKVTRVSLDDGMPVTPVEDFRIYSKRAFIARQMEDLAFCGDTLHALQVQLGLESNYGDFVWLSNMAALYHIRRYAYVDDSFFFFANPPETASSIEIEPLYLDNIVEDKDYKPPTAFQIFLLKLDWKWQILRYDILNNLPIVIGFFSLIVIPWTVGLRGRRTEAL